MTLLNIFQKVIHRGWPFLGLLFAFTVYAAVPERGQSGLPFGVSFYGQPTQFGLPIIPYAVGEFGTFRITHALDFDGERYRSQLYIPALESYLYPESTDSYCWRTPWGSVIHVKIGMPFRYGKTTLSLNREGQIIEVRAANNQLLCVYEGGKLQHVSAGDLNWQFTYVANTVELRISKGDSQICPTIAEGIGADHRISAISCGKAQLSFRYNKDGQFRECFDLSEGRAVMSFDYQNNLLHDALVGTARNQYEWTRPTSLLPFIPEVPPFPVVCNDGLFKYDVSISIYRMEVRFESLTGGTTGTWKVDSGNGEIFLHFDQRQNLTFGDTDRK